MFAIVLLTPYGRKEILNTNFFISTVLPSFHLDMNRQGFAAARLTWPTTLTVGNVKIALTEKIL